MAEVPPTPWHRESWARFLHDRLPGILSERLPLGGYSVEVDGPAVCRVRVALAAPGPVEAPYVLPLPDEQGVFLRGGKPVVVVPVASSDELDTADIRCAGEQMADLVATRLGQAPADMEWDEVRLRMWLPLEAWVDGLMLSAQPLDTTNWLSAHTHLRRVRLPLERRTHTPGHVGRVCPVETPEGPNVGRVLTIARGATIRDGRIVVVDDRPAAGLGLTASTLPFMEHTDAARLVMAANMLRQWLTPRDSEPALVQTGAEPDDPPFWCGRNLLTAYVSWGCDTFEDSILISESCARRLGYRAAIQPGDKLSNRSGNKGVVSRVAPDDAMPHLADGTPVELVFSPLSLYSRMTFGQLKEAACSWVARQRGRPVVAAPLAGPSDGEIQAMLRDAGVPDTGQQVLLAGKDGPPMELPSTVGWVYWGKLRHLAGPKLHATVSPRGAQKIGEPELHALLHAGATATVRELYNTRAAGRPGAWTLSQQVAAGAVEQADPPSPRFADLRARLAAAGIEAALEGGGAAFRMSEEVGGEALALAVPVPHPWHPAATLRSVGFRSDVPAALALAAANDRLGRMVAGRVPDSLRRAAQAELQTRLREYLDALVGPDSLRFSARPTFSGRAVAIPDCSLRHDEVGLPEAMAWALFGPMVQREMGQSEPVVERTAEAGRMLDAVMRRSWVVLYRVTVAPAPFVAFRPVRGADPVMRLHPFTCRLLDVDFDGDEPAVFLPVTEAGQHEAGELLSVSATTGRELEPARHARPLLDARYGSFLLNVRPIQDSRFGLAWLALTPDGHRELEELAGVPLPLEDGVLTGSTLQEAQTALVARGGVECMLDAMDRLMRRGFEAARSSGASLSPFLASPVAPPMPPGGDDPDAWSAYTEEFASRLAAYLDDPATNRDPVKLVLKSGARGTLRQWLWSVGLPGMVRASGGGLAVVKHGYAPGLTPEEQLTMFVGMKEGLARAMGTFFEVQREVVGASPPAGYGVLARAMRSPRPGVVFARAAAAGETDPLRDVRSRMFVGL